MVEKINTQHSWRQITSPGRVKKVKPRPDYNRDKGSNKNGHKGGYGKGKGSGKAPGLGVPNGEDPDDSGKKPAADAEDENTGVQKDRTGRTPGKVIDIVV